jgi:nicotinate-nucleotide adenylyltransferase
MRIALFGGSFDPVHHGHLLLAQDALEQLQLDRLIFIPAGINPHKLQSAPKADGHMRLRMLQAAIAGEERLGVDPMELQRDGPSYTVDTVETLHEQWPEARLFLLLGEDNLPKLHTWHKIERLNQLVDFVCFGRSTEEAMPSASSGVFHLSRRVDISSTEIRHRIAAGLSIRYLVPESVRAFIYTHAIYQPHQP